MKTVSRALNIAILSAAILLGVVAVKSFTAGRSRPYYSDVFAAGNQLHLPGIDFSASNGTFVLAVSPGCGFCSESAPLYRRLAVRAVQDDDLRFIVIVPAPAAVGRRYMEEIGVPAPEIRQAYFASLRIIGTPTMILVGRDGRIRDSWIGKLKPSAEAEVWAALPASSRKTAVISAPR